MCHLLISSLLLLLWPFVCPVIAVADFSGPVVSVLDGDTLEVLHNSHPERIRFSGIDRPSPANDVIRVTRRVIDSTRRG
jgi:endonuclease YncB( thermonuclease family)